MINYMNKGEGLSLFLADNGVTLSEVYSGGVVAWECNVSDDHVNTMINSYNPWHFEKTKKLREINSWLEIEGQKLADLVPTVEQKNWPTQVNEAFGLMPLNLLVSLAGERGITVEDLISRVKQNHNDYCAAYGKLQGKRDRIKTAVNAFPDEGNYELLPELWALSCTG
jgi:hypothetical protein